MNLSIERPAIIRTTTQHSMPRHVQARSIPKANPAPSSCFGGTIFVMSDKGPDKRVLDYFRPEENSQYRLLPAVLLSLPVLLFGLLALVEIGTLPAPGWIV